MKTGAGKAGVRIDPAAARLLAKRAGTDISTLRGDLDRLLLYAAGKPKITEADAREVVTTESSQDDWAVTNAIQRGQTGEALLWCPQRLHGTCPTPRPTAALAGLPGWRR